MMVRPSPSTFGLPVATGSVEADPATLHDVGAGADLIPVRGPAIEERRPNRRGLRLTYRVGAHRPAIVLETKRVGCLLAPQPNVVRFRSRVDTGGSRGHGRRCALGAKALGHSRERAPTPPQ